MMASAGGSSGPGGEGGPFKRFPPPPSPKFVPRTDNEEPLTPDTEDHVQEQTEGIFKNFIYQRLQDDQMKNPGDLETPFVPELTNFHDAPLSANAQIGRRLALIGDDINRKYEHEFRDMIQALRITPDTAYEAFAGVARK
ncbi:bcl-2 homologous antagonist/killer-like [Lingula anatina]|uniref:Bcl-2 homologous antagonist/killer-like n=1 Tax=Lingula anatina TaxID=7574 RepID=A0A1S3KGU3_LINAN|nr:bcl-2 homologous antagonist/killer-like [Lingula anatina]XP_013421858.1 bcl-2 homologous antagonist/killer-like [Lingula anatina]XP_013421859.1 bcl-2 homologous antagonist/killer-like [Lingula anatina]XP_013421861.1 bcl-2 homologous antagonist/killer-like [Lingula anatina]XP_013421862.1 bcl-2 homologous antagonist/killer-like [Lingula anatina]XP_013421863.1 bcl-2 homologous antagonist/killer-like [Lingula anatina]|eukprot:XP_013421857.1 bcl-2 homologous antagonist/killer-like [Lingula anatina]